MTRRLLNADWMLGQRFRQSFSINIPFGERLVFSRYKHLHVMQYIKELLGLKDGFYVKK